MKSTNAADRCKRNDTMDRFCAPGKNMLYEPINDWDRIDAVLVKESDIEKKFGVAKIVTQLGKFGNKPYAEVNKEVADFLDNLAVLCSFGAAVIFRFKDKEMYWRVKNPEKLQSETSVKRGKTVSMLRVPIQELKPIQLQG